MRRLAALMFLIVAGVAAPAAATPVTSPTQAPYVVLVVSSEGGCTGTLIDPSHVLTSAECATDEHRQPLPTSGLAIMGGTVAQGPLGPDAQHTMVSEVRIHPAYLATGGLAANLAMLKLSTPLTTTAAVAPAALADLGAASRYGSAATAYAWGLTGGADPNARSEQTWNLRLDGDLCLDGLSGYACGTPTTDARCSAAPGGPVVADDRARLIGMVVGHSLVACGGRRDQTYFVDLTVPGIAEWVLGDDTPPEMPFTRGRSVLKGPPGRGGAISCTPPSWSHTSAVVVDFFRDYRQIVQRGRRRTYVPKPSDVGHEIECRSVAGSPGGTAMAPATTTVSIVRRRGERYRICVKPEKRARSCRWWRPR